MREATPLSLASDETSPGTAAFYRCVLETLNASGIKFLVGGAYAFNCYTGISRQTKDLDIFIRRQDYESISAALGKIGYETELTYPHWLAKAHYNDDFVDLIFNSGNGVAEVDDIWFDHAPDAEVLGIRTRISPVEEMIWSKAFVMERERFDGADIAHLIRARGRQLDWQHLLNRFGDYWRVLLSHLILFGFIYPGQRSLVPAWLMGNLLERLQQETHAPPSDSDVCLGLLLSREQYLMDIEQWGYLDARIVPFGNMTAKDTARWTEAIQHKDNPQ